MSKTKFVRVTFQFENESKWAYSSFLLTVGSSTKVHKAVLIDGPMEYLLEHSHKIHSHTFPCPLVDGSISYSDPPTHQHSHAENNPFNR